MTNNNDDVNHSAHYNRGKFEAIEVIRDWKLDFWTGNALKYLARAGFKNPDELVKDLKEAVFYLNDKIKELEEEDKQVDLFENPAPTPTPSKGSSLRERNGVPPSEYKGPTTE